MSDANDGPEGRGKRAGTGAGFSAARGAVLVAIAVIIGIVLLQAIDDGNSGPIGDGSTSSTSSTTAATTPASTDGDTSSTTAKPATKAPADTTVKVLNGSGVQGAATTVTNTLKSKGYKTLLPNTVVVQKGTFVYYAAGLQTECKALTAYVPNSTVAAVPNPVPGGEAADCIVVLGT